MSSEEAVQEVRRIFTNNTVEQVRDYLSTITRGIQESDYRLKQIVGQSYRDLIAACDKVVGMEQTCRKLLQMQKQLHTEQQLTLSPQSPGDVLERGPFSRRGAHSASSEATPVRCLFEVAVERQTQGREAERNEAEALSSAPCDRLVFQQRCVAIEGLLGSQQVQKAATVWHELMDGLECEKRLAVKSMTTTVEFQASIVSEGQGKQHEQRRLLLESYRNRIRQGIRELLRKDADDAAQRTVTYAIATKRSVRGGGSMRETQRHATANATADSVTLGDEFLTDVLAHMAEAHAALGIIDIAPAALAMQNLIELVSAMINDELQLILKAINGGNKRKRGSESACGTTNTVKNPSGKMEWLRVALPLPMWLLDDAANSPLSTAWIPLSMEAAHSVGNDITTSATTTDSSHPVASVAGRSNCKTSNGVIALHILQRTQQLFFHLVAYVASVLPRLYEHGRDAEKRPLSQHHGGVDDDDGANDREDVDGYGNYKRQQRSLQTLLTLRGRLVAKEQKERQKQQEEDGGKDLLEFSNRMSSRMGGSSARGALSSSLLSAPEEIGDASLSESTSAMSILLPGGFNAPKRTHLRTIYIREVMRQVCGMQLLDPKLLQGRKPAKRFSGVDSGSDHKNSPAALEWKCEDVSRKLRIVQETVSQLLGCVADAGLLRSPRLVALQERIALQEATRMQKWLRESHRQNVLLFEDALWTEMVHKTTERALVRAVGAGLRKADVVWNAILQSIRVEGSCHAHHQSITPSIRPYVETDAVTTTKPGTSSQLSQRLLSRSFFASRLIAAVHCGGGCRNESVFSFSNPEGRMRSSGKESATINALLARAVVQCVWSHSKMASFEGKTQDTCQLYTNNPHNFISAASSKGCVSSDTFTAMMDGEKHVLAFEEEEEMLFVDDDDENDNDDVDDDGKNEGGKEEEKRGEGNTNVRKGNNGNHLEEKKKAIMCMFPLYSGRMERKIALNDDQAAVFERSVLLYMLQRIFDSERLCAVAQTPVHNLITAWISGALGRVRDMMREEKEAYQQQLQQQQEDEGESFERCAAMMVFFHRLSLLVEVLLCVLETTPAVSNTAGALWEEVRGTVIACHMPWVQLLRREWESGLCAAYREAWAAVRVPTVDAVAPSLAARRYTLGYAACWCHDFCRHPHQPQQREEEKGEQPVAYPIHLTPHVAELLFSLQHILYTVGAGQRLRETVLPIVIRELLDGTSSALLNVVLPSLAEDKRHLNDSANSNAGGGGDFPARSCQAGSVVNSAASHDTEGNKDDTDDDDEKDEALLQLYFDVLFITGLFASPDKVSNSSTAAVLQAIESRVDPVTWSVTAPFVKSASARLLRATTLSFGSWCSAAAAEVWNVAGSNAQSGTENMQPHQSPLFNGAITTPKERDRFPLLPLATTAPSIIPSVGGTHPSLKVRGGSEGRGGATSSCGAADVGSGDGSLPPAASTGGKEPVTPSFTATLLWGDGTTKGWMGSLW
ncbi:hypothetical protein C3747_32g177 [Trypanosoma cruzi]|uniref:Conserved oligomeric Golgi complex subunit 1 n=2 Tax=Trypanosoma cruzi TaxID=5693 RepID=Q4E335_TRYCC|nr:hypothetical protein, conserved [Trypanosoma cruzi]EAN99217.1 hypothetical protein, conserved [Trypanosoma cruzi]PWV15011.1 hypothetical protein C3747_32g177 [Trypanosoma cruzi]RNC46819.1 hypothetical protein TcCL_NonESM03310 [Trypanosoma cruzi]|eukprot:XP_821068.1 hypothetical protein [Trypanosoma cruzi strain CL Brener]